MFGRTIVTLAAVLALAGSSLASYQEVLSGQYLFDAVTTDTPNTLGASINDGVTTSYHVVKRSNPSLSWIVKVDNYNSGSPTASVLAPWSGNLNMGRAFGLAGGNLVIGDGTTDTIYKVDVNTGSISNYVTTAEILAQTGGDSLQGNYSYTQPNGEMIFWEDDTDALWVTNGASTVESYLTNEAIANAQGVGVGDGRISSQLTFVDDVMLFGASNTDAVYAYDPTAAAPNPGDNITEILSQTDITSVTGEATAGFADLIYNDADGLVYFRELTSKSFLAFDPADPANTLAVVLSQEQLEAGPAGSAFTIGGASLVDGEFAWSSNPNGYYAVPEPSSLILFALAVLGLRRR